MKALLAELCKLPGVTARRQNAGKVLDVREDGSKRMFVGAPAGAGDIVGMAWPGIYFEVETKSDVGTQTPEQKRWQAMVERRGGLYVLAPRTPGKKLREGARLCAETVSLMLEKHRMKTLERLLMGRITG